MQQSEGRERDKVKMNSRESMMERDTGRRKQEVSSSEIKGEDKVERGR